MPLFEPVCVAPTGDLVGEGAVWCAPEQSVYWTDINRFLVHRHDTTSANTRSWFFEEPVVALSLSNEPGRWLVALASRLLWWWPETDRRLAHGFVLEGSPRVRLNDGRADALGNFWVGSMRNNVLPNGELGEAGGNDGKMFRIAPNGDVTEHITGLGISNTVCWSPDGGTFYTADTLANVIWAYAFNPSDASLGARRVLLAGWEHGMPDGSAIDAQGYLWNCRFFGRSLVRIAPDGRVDRVIDMPVKNITTACFGGPDLRTLYVTSASVHKDPGDRLAGSLWAIPCAVPGLPERCVRVGERLAGS
jgi:sugar lactone lactonase YvrE